MLSKSIGPAHKKSPISPIAPANSESGKKLGFDFVQFQRHVETKAPQTTNKKWRMVGDGNGELPCFTRKRFGGFNNFFAKNSARALTDKASPAANVLQATFDRQPKVLAAAAAIGKGVKDTKELQGHLLVLAAAQTKWAAKKPVDEAAEALRGASAKLKQQKQELQKLHDVEWAQAGQRLKEMEETREHAMAWKQATLEPKQKRVAEKSRHIAEKLVLKVTEALPPPDRASKASRKAKPKLGFAEKAKAVWQLPRQSAQKEDPAKAKQKLRMQALTEKAGQRLPVGPVNREALYKEMQAQAEASDQTVQAQIEYLLIDLPVGAYLPVPVFEALRELHAELSGDAEKQYLAAANAQLELGKQELAQLERRYHEALEAYTAVPMPG